MAKETVRNKAPAKKAVDVPDKKPSKKRAPGRGSLERAMLEDFLEKSFSDASARANQRGDGTIPGTVPKDIILENRVDIIDIKNNTVEIKVNTIEDNVINLEKPSIMIDPYVNKLDSKDNNIDFIVDITGNEDNQTQTAGLDNPSVGEPTAAAVSDQNLTDRAVQAAPSSFDLEEIPPKELSVLDEPDAEGKEKSQENNIENRVDNIENLCYETPNNIETYVIQPSGREKQGDGRAEITKEIYDNNIDIKVNGEKITKEIYDNNIDIYVNPKESETNSPADETFVPRKNQLYLDGMKLYTAIGSLKLSRSEKTIIEALYRYGEKMNSLDLELLLYQFVQSVGISNFTICKSNKKLSECGLFDHFVSTRRTGTFIRLKSSFFYTDDRKIDRYKIFLSIRDKHPVFISCILELLLDSANVNKVLQKNILSFTEGIRKNLSVSPQKEMTECGALLTAVLKNLLVPGISIRNISSYLNAVLKKEGLSLVERLTNSEIENGRKFSRLLERIFKGELDELSAEDLSFLLGETVLRSDGAEKIYGRLCAVLEKY
jgi:hypothetical protein